MKATLEELQEALYNEYVKWHGNDFNETIRSEYYSRLGLITILFRRIEEKRGITP